MPIGVALHWDGTHSEPDHANCQGQVDGIAAYHEATGRGPGPAYNWLACRHGGKFEGKGWGFLSSGGRVNYANGTNEANRDYWAICYMGGPDDPFTDEGKVAILELMAEQPDATARATHDDFFPSTCPGGVIREWVDAGCPAPDSTQLQEVDMFLGRDDRTGGYFLFGTRKLGPLSPQAVTGLEAVGVPQKGNIPPEVIDAFPFEAVEEGAVGAAGVDAGMVAAVVRAELDRTKLSRV